ncbi:MAG TPA: hypothetical protein VKS19_02365, partial [Verrucomicrobiae bacterium]|nr:hypothetical protein [Verrucomicrobiae bacterium]
MELAVGSELVRITFAGPGSDRTFAFRLGQRLGRWIAESEQNPPRFFLLPAIQLAERSAKGFQSKIVLAGGAFGAIEE